ncbi:MAG: tail protein X [Burkholderiaceae bacterium]|jgi:phage tail protein X|nr:tail protein X [Burkholderiaceae bacterium]
MYLTHITKEGERWDWLAWQYYRDVNKMGLILENNTHIPLCDVLPSGVVLRIPIIQRDDAALIQELPPWKR